MLWRAASFSPPYAARLPILPRSLIVERDHRRISSLADAVDAAARALTPEQEGVAARQRLTVALGALSDFLLAHLSYEETALAPVLAGWPEVPHS